MGWKKIITSGSNAELKEVTATSITSSYISSSYITASGLKILDSIDLPQSITLTTDINYQTNLKPSTDNATDIGEYNKRWQDGYFAGTIYGTSSNSLTSSYSDSLRVSQSISASNINIGNPTSNNWNENLEGSYFNLFNNNTNVSEILRFMAGLLSSSAASPTPNTKTYGLTTDEDNLGSTATILGRVPQNVTLVGNETLTYLSDKGFADVGSTIFSGLSVYHDNFSSYNINFDSNAGGSTTIQSSVDSQLFGLGELTNGDPTEFKVRIISTQSFSDISSITSPNESNHKYTTHSQQDLNISTFGTSNGLTLAKILTDSPAVIPPVYQDGKFVSVGALNRKYHTSKTSNTSVSSSGYYNFHDLKVGIATGTGDYNFINGTSKNRFWAPRDTINTEIGNNNISYIGGTYKTLTATSRSLSGVPYLLTATYEVSRKITGLFSPMYLNGDTIVSTTSTGLEGGTINLSGDKVNLNNGDINTNYVVYQSDGTTPVNYGTPRYNDLVIITSSVNFDAGTGGNTNIDEDEFLGNDFTIRTTTKNRSNSDINYDITIPYHTAGNFNNNNQLGFYGRAQGYDGSSLTGTSENFSGESHRRQLNNNLLSFADDTFTTSYSLTPLGQFDLQVKPGFLVNPNGSRRYYYGASDIASATYKYYVRKFQTSGTKTSMTLNVGKTLTNWNVGGGVAISLLFKSSGTNGNNTSFSTARIYDPSSLTSGLMEVNISNDNFKNPFTNNIDLYGNTGGSKNGTIYTVPMRNPDGMFLDSSDNGLYVIVRYTGDQDPITSINLTFS